MASIGTSRQRLSVWLAAASLVVPLAGCGTTDREATPEGSDRIVEIASDLPLEGDAKASSEETDKAMRLYLERVHNKAGRYQVRLKSYNDATAVRGSWDDATCVKNAVEHVRSAEVAVMGTYNSGCARLMVPVLNHASNGPLLMVSHANSNPGLTKSWGKNEPKKFSPTGTRGYARVAATDDKHGAAGASFVKNTLNASRCYVLNDGQLYGMGVARAFADAAAGLGVTILGNQSWDLGKSDYTSMFREIAALRPDCVYLGGVFENKGSQVIKDKVAVLGDNSAVPMLAPDGFSGYRELVTMPQASGLYLTFGGLSVEQLVEASPVAASFVPAYQRKYGSAPTSSYPLYAVAALQVILGAIQASDGSREGVNRAVFGSADNLTVPASESITGQNITIDRETGDVTATAMTVLQIRGGVESFVSSQSVS